MSDPHPEIRTPEFPKVTDGRLNYQGNMRKRNQNDSDNLDTCGSLMKNFHQKEE